MKLFKIIAVALAINILQIAKTGLLEQALTRKKATNTPTTSLSSYCSQCQENILNEITNDLND